MALERSGLDLVAEGADKYNRDLAGATKSTNSFGGALGGLPSMLGGVAAGAAGLAALAGGAVVAGLGGAAAAGLGFNNSMEQATAKINAFTKDGAVTAEILEMVRERAAATPFAFEEMANSAAALIPVARAANVPLEKILETSEILAASNPAEGLEGAAFALKEAVSGDFTSIIERFNLPRQYINQLKQEGVPALEIVQRAMQEMGLDYDLVGNLANTAQGRMSTFQDTLTTLAGVATKPIFDAFSAGLGKVNEILGKSAPRLEAAAASIGTALAPAAAWLGEVMVDTANGFVFAVDVTAAFLDLISADNIFEAVDAYSDLSSLIGTDLATGISQVVFALQQDGIIAALEVIAQYTIEWAANMVTAFSQWVVEAVPPMIAELQNAGSALLQWAADQAPGWLASLQTLGQALGEWVMVALPGLISSLADARMALFQWVADSLPGWVSKLDELRTAFIDWVAKALPDIGTNLGKIAAVIVEKTGEFVAFAVPELAKLGAAFITWVATEALPRLPGELANISAAIVTAAGNFVSEVWPEIVKLSEQFTKWVQEEVIPKLPGELAKIGTAITTGIGAFLANATAEATKLGTAIVDGIKAGIASGLQAVKDAAVKVVTDAIAAAKNAIISKSPSKLAAAEVGEPISEGIAVGVMSGADLIAGAVTEMAQLVISGLGIAMPAAVEQGAWDTERILSGLGVRIKDFGDEVSGVIDGIGKVTSETLAESLGEGVKDAFAVVDEMPPALRDKLGKTTDEVKQLADDVSPEALSTGEAIAAGVVEGISKDTPKIQDAIQQALKSALDAAKSALGIASPSAVMAAEVGEPISQGVAEGILAAIGAATSAAETLSDEVLKQLTTLADKAQKILDDILSGQIGFGRGAAGALDAIDDIEQRIADREAKANEARQRVADAQRKSQDELAAIARERADLEVTARQNVDPRKRLEAQRKLAELATKEAEIRRKAAEEQARLAREAAQRDREAVAAQQAGARASLALQEAQARAAELAGTDPEAARDFLALRTRQIREIQALEERLGSTTDAGTRQLLEQQIALIRQAQARELEQFGRQQRRRADEARDLADDARKAGEGAGGELLTALAERIAAGGDAIADALLDAISRAIGGRVAAPAAAASAIAVGSTTYGDTSVTINGSSLSVSQLREVIRSVLAESAGRTGVIARMG